MDDSLLIMANKHGLGGPVTMALMAGASRAQLVDLLLDLHVKRTTEARLSMVKTVFASPLDQISKDLGGMAIVDDREWFYGS